MQLHIINASIVFADNVSHNSSLTVEDGRIKAINGGTSGGYVMDAMGAYLMPGMIDVHSDHIEQIIEPRLGSIVDVAYAVQEQEKQLVNQGITTMYQSLSMWKPANTSARTKAAREDGNLLKIAEEVTSPDAPPRLINQRLHIRFDITNTGAVPVLKDLLSRGRVSLLSFMDHTPGQGQYRDVGRFAQNMKNHNPQISDDEINERLQARINAERVSREELTELANMAKRGGISIASHDDDSVQKIDFVRDILGATISEFPVELEMARYAHKRGMTTLGGAPNVLIGKSHSGNMSAAEGVLDGSITAICSDYYPPAMLQAVFKLHREYGLPLNQCANLVSLAPAKAVGIGDRTGSIEVGKSADLILVDANGKYPRLIASMVNGNISSTINYSNTTPCAVRSA